MATIGKATTKKKGYLYKLPLSSGIIKVWSKRWVVLYATSREGVVRVEYYDSEEDQLKGHNKRNIHLRSCTSCGKTSEYKRFAFTFSTHLGRHVFAADSEEEVQSWVENIQSAIKEDRRQQKQAKLRSARAQKSYDTGSSLTSSTSMDDSEKMSLSSLMGMFRVTLEQNDMATKLNLTGIYNLDITPSGISLIASTTETVIAKWKFKNIRGYSKSGNQFTLDIGKRSQTGEGKIVFNSNATKELFGVFHRNIKKLKIEKEKKMESSLKEEVVEMRKKKESSEEARHLRNLRARSISYELQTKPRPKVSSSSLSGASSEKRTSCPDFDILDDSNMIRLEGLFEEDEEDEDEVSAMIRELDPLHNPGDPQHESMGGLEDLITPLPSGDPFANESDPFKNVTDPFSSSVAAKGTFYNSNEDILGSFDDIHLPTNMSTPIRQPPPADQHQSAQEHSTSTNGDQSSNPFAKESFVSTSFPPTSSGVCNPFAQNTSNSDTFSPDSSMSFGSINPELLQAIEKLDKQNLESVPMKPGHVKESAPPASTSTTTATTSTEAKRSKKKPLPKDLTETLDDLDKLWKDLDATLKTSQM